MIILQNEWLRAVLNPQGAELQSLQHLPYGIEHMWDGDAAFWAKHSPVLFPIIGALKDNSYFFEGHSYQLPRHGFAREKLFSATQISSTAAVFTLADDEETRALYPFQFQLQLRYDLQEHSICCRYEVTNPGNNELLFSIGGHPAFAVPFVPNDTYEDYYLELNESEILQRCKLQDGLIGNHTEPLPTPGNRIALKHSLFYEDAIVLKNMRSNRITLAAKTHTHGLHFCFDNFPYFGIWAAKNAPFVCLEPWCGIADSIGHDQELSHKEGVERLPAQGMFKREWRVDCF